MPTSAETSVLVLLFRVSTSVGGVRNGVKGSSIAQRQFSIHQCSDCRGSEEMSEDYANERQPVLTGGSIGGLVSLVCGTTAHGANTLQLI